MPITVQKKRHSKKGTNAQTSSCNEDHSANNSFFSRIPTTCILLFLIFLWAVSTTLISGSIVHVCVTSRKLTNNQLYCLTAGANPSNDTYTFADSAKTLTRTPTEVPPANEIKITDSVAHVSVPSSPLIQLPKANDAKQDGKNMTSSAKESVKSANLTNRIIPPPAYIAQETNYKSGDEVSNKEVESHMEILRSYKTRKSINYNDPDACDGNGIFVYDLPSKFNKDLLDACKFLSNGGFGEPVAQLGNGWYDTHHCALEPIFHARALKHPCRVQEPGEAKVFYVPFYGGLEMMKSHMNEKSSNEIKDKVSGELIEWLEKQRFWKRNFGLDHVFVLGKVSWDFRRGKNATWGTRFLELDEMQNPTKLLLERHPWHSNDVAVPYPTFFHPRSDNDIVAWQTKIMQIPRKTLVSFAGTPRPNTAKSIRTAVINQCTSATTKCKYLNCNEGQCTKPAPLMHLLMDSEFCLHPSGESATRKSLFDSLLAGCIPVVFDPFTADYQYPWHLPTDRSDYSVFVDGKVVIRGEVNVVDRLAAVSAARRAEMRSYIVYEVMPGLVYGDQEAKLERFEDAFSVAMSSVIQRMGKFL